MRFVYFLLCATLFSAGDYLCSIGGTTSRIVTTFAGALVGALGYGVFAYLSRETPLSALGGYINGAVVIITCVFFGHVIQGNSVSTAEWIWIAVIFLGICGLAYARSAV